jgi:2-iminobutanoate/2-iminopropanoate deaminase
MELVSGGIEEEAKQAFRNISNLLREYSSGLKDVIKATIYLKNIEDIEIVDNIYKNYFVLKPARTIIGVSGLPKNALIEIEVIAKKQATSTGF